MQDLPQKVYSVESVRAMDRCAIDSHAIPGFTLMTRAGEALFSDACEFRADRWCVVCGAGNNAGDGYVVARLAHEQGLLSSLIAVGDPDQLRGDALRAKDAFIAAGGEITRWSGAIPGSADLLIDALLGSGIEREVHGDFRAAIDAMNRHPASCYAVDIPSGLDGQTGHVLGVAVRAARTMTFVGLKAGLFLAQGPDYCGELLSHGLDIPADCAAQQPAMLNRLLESDLKAAFSPRSKTANKGEFGHVLVVGGGPGMPGAPLLAGTAALRAGAGRVTVATHPQHAAALVSATPELMCLGVQKGHELQDLLDRVDCLVFGPGLGQSDWALELYDVLKSSTLPAVWDADALNLLAKQPAVGQQRILTPHPGEAARLLGITASDIQDDRLSALQELQQKYGGTIVLKGAGTLVSGEERVRQEIPLDGAGTPNPDESVVPWICTAGNPGMAAPGMGDVLSGILAACIAQKVPARLGVLLHAKAGDRVAEFGERGMLASDLFPAIREEVNAL